MLQTPACDTGLSVQARAGVDEVTLAVSLRARYSSSVLMVAYHVFTLSTVPSQVGTAFWDETVCPRLQSTLSSRNSDVSGRSTAIPSQAKVLAVQGVLS
jgi:hypothetical protein